MDLQAKMNEKFDELVESGFIDEVVTTSLKASVAKMADNMFGSYSKMSKELEKYVEENMKLNFSQLGLGEYNKMVCDIVKAQLEETALGNATDRITKQINNIVGEVEKKEWNLSEIIEKFIGNEVSEDDQNEGGEISLHIKKSTWGSIYVSFDKEEGTSDYDCEYRLSINDGEKKNDKRLWNFEIKGKIPNPVKDPIIGYFDGFLFKLYANECQITVDDCETTYSRYED